MTQSCSIAGCDRKYYALGWCEMHWRRARKHGDPLKGRNHAPLEERFWRYVDKRNPDECWLWKAKTERNGYGRIQVGGKGSPLVLAHRLSFKIANGYDPEVVMHVCDVPGCVNPSHLRAGTHKENTQDMIAKGRRPTIKAIGERSGAAVLTEYLVRQIRSQPDETHAALARRYKVAVTTIRSVRSGKTWKHVT